MNINRLDNNDVNLIFHSEIYEAIKIAANKMGMSIEQYLQLLLVNMVEQGEIKYMRSTMNILIYDDDELILYGLRRLIESEHPDIEILTTFQSSTALDLLENLPIDLLILDGHCHKSGHVGKKALSKNMRVVICTGDHNFSKNDFKEILYKPFDFNELNKIITDK